MIDSVVGHIARRGVRVGVKCMHGMRNQPPPGIQVHQQQKNQLEELLEKLKSPAAIAAFVATSLLFFFAIFSIEYAIRVVAVNLASVEDSEGSGNIKLPLNADDDDANSISKAPLLDDVDDDDFEQQGNPVPPKMITSSLCSTFRHLRSVGGRLAKFRGLQFAIVYALGFGLFSTIFTLIFSAFLGPLGMPISNILAAICSCNLHAAWTHATISKPSATPFLKRFLPRSVARQLILPTIRLHAGLMLARFGAAGTAMLVNRHRVTAFTAPLFVLPVVVFLAIQLLHVVPSHIALVRAEAALLPESEDCIVPLDKTFGGRVLAREAFPTRKAYILRNLSLRGAYAQFDRPTYMRVVKMLVKMACIVFAFIAFYAIAITAEVYLFAGKEATEVSRIMLGGHRG